MNILGLISQLIGIKTLRLTNLIGTILEQYDLSENNFHHSRTI